MIGRAGSRTGSGVSLLIQFSMSAFSAIVIVSLLIVGQQSSAPIPIQSLYDAQKKSSVQTAYSKIHKRDLANFFNHSERTFLTALYSKSQYEKSVSTKLHYTREHNTHFLSLQSCKVPPP